MGDTARRSFICLMSLLPALLMWIGCQSTYYAVWESLGKEKRHLLRDEVEQAREDQAEASEEFKDALTRIKELTGFEGEIRWDASKPDGQPRRCLDTTKAMACFGFAAKIPLEAGLRETIDWYKEMRSQGRA